MPKQSLIPQQSTTEMAILLQTLKTYRGIIRSAGSRAKRVFLAKFQRTIRIEYFPWLSRSDAEICFTSLFQSIIPDIEHIAVSYTENSCIAGGIRVFIGDDCYDCSYADARARLSRKQ